MTSCDVIRLSWSRKIRRPRFVIADIAETVPRFPITVCLGVCPHGAHILPNSAVREAFASSWKSRIAFVLLHGSAGPRHLSAHPRLSFLLRQLKVLSFWLLIGQTRFIRTPHDGLFGQEHTELGLNDVNQSSCGPEIPFTSILGRRCQDNAL